MLAPQKGLDLLKPSLANCAKLVKHTGSTRHALRFVVAFFLHHLPSVGAIIPWRPDRILLITNRFGAGNARTAACAGFFCSPAATSITMMQRSTSFGAEAGAPRGPQEKYFVRARFSTKQPDPRFWKIFFGGPPVRALSNRRPVDRAVFRGWRCGGKPPVSTTPDPEARASQCTKRG